MKVHFIGSLDGSKDDYKRIISSVENFGWEVVTKHALERNIAEVEKESPEEAELYARKMKSWMKQCDVAMVEATKSVFGAGYEVATALYLNKPVIVLYKPFGGNIPHVLKGIESDKLQVVSYNGETLEETVKTTLEYAQETVDTRFNFFISPSLSHYLDWVAQTKKIPRSVYLRQLIEEDREKHKEYFDA